MLSTLIADYHGYGPDGWGPGPWVIPLFWLIVVLIGLAVWRFGRFRRSPAHDARATLADRYARGEIDEDEYRRRSTVLEEARS